MNTVTVIGKEITVALTSLCKVQDKNRLGLLGYHLYAEDGQKNPQVIILGGKATKLVVIPVAPTPSPVFAWFGGHPLYLPVGESLMVAVPEAPKMAPAKLWGTVWLL